MVSTEEKKENKELSDVKEDAAVIDSAAVSESTEVTENAAVNEGVTVNEVTINTAPQQVPRFYMALSELGEYFVGVFIKIVKFIGLCFLYLIAAIYRGLMRIKKPFMSLVKNIADTISEPFRRHRKARRLRTSEITRARREKGMWGGVAARMKVTRRTVFGKRGLLATLVNWGLPVASCIFFFNVVSYANSQNYALKLTVNGDFVGYINDEHAFTEAEKMVQSRINYTGSSTEVISFDASYEVENVGSSPLLNQYQVADKMLTLLGKDVKNGYGLYLGDSYYGTLDSHDRLDRAMTNLLSKYTSGGEKETAKFGKQISYISGTYLADSFVDEDDIIRQFTSYKKNPTYYTIKQGEYIDDVLKATGLTSDELTKLNPDFDIKTDFIAGNRLKTSMEEPFMTVMVTREEHYIETFDYETRYENDPTMYVGNNQPRVEGELGERSVVANVSYINGNEVNRRVLSRTLTKEPVTKVIAVGTKPRTNTTAPGTTIEAGKMLWPVGGYDGGTLEEPVWWKGGYYGHKGVDITTALGTPIYAAENGVVVSAVWAGNGDDRGNYVIIQGDSGLTTYYYHNSELLVSSGERVTAGDMIAHSGMTGRAYGPHCHFGVSVGVGGQYLNPTDYLPYHKQTASYAAKVAAHGG